MPTLTFKVTPDEARAIRTKARAEKATVSAFLRARVLDAPNVRPRRRIIRRHPVSGLCYDATAAGAPVVSQEQIRAALADFP
ncbi:MAG: plasmid mobilization protein [Verrucomicrobiota bacterium]